MVYISTAYCPKCDEYQKGPNRGHAGVCPSCSSERKWRTVEKGGEHDPRIRKEFCNWSGMMKENVRVSRSLGVHPAQLKEVQKLCPGTEWKKMGSSFCPVIHNRAEKLKLMKKFNFVEYPSNLHEQRVSRGLH
jgi:uncharacterized metal-binding protein